MQLQYTQGIGMEDGEARQDCVHLQVVGCIEALLVLSSFVVKESKIMVFL